LSQFFAEIRIVGAAPVESGAVLILGNHPNFALDSLVIASIYQRELWFLGKATLFRHPIAARILGALHVIPVERRQDSATDTGRNEETFRRAAGILEGGGALALFPEGVSRGERALAPLKTGAARIAFQSEAGRDFALGLVVQPVGITYGEMHSFRSAVTVTFGEPIRVAEFAADYANDAIGAVRELTARCQRALEGLTVHVREAEHRSLIEKIARVYRATDSTLDERARLELIARNVEDLAPRLPERAAELNRQIDGYLDIAGVFALDSGESLDEPFDAMLTTVLCPVVLLGVVVHLPPYRLIGAIARRATEPVVLASLKLGLGVVLFPVWYLLLGVVAACFGGGWWWGFFAVALALFSGYCVNNYLHRTRLFILSNLWPGRRKPVDVVKVLRDDLIAELERLRVV